MNRWLKRIRGAVGIGLTWAVVWGGVGAILRFVVGVISGAPFDELATGVFGVFSTFAILGFVGGVAFSTVLVIAEDRRRFDEMSLPRFAGWGAVGGLLLAALMFTVGWGSTPGDAIFMGIMPLLGARSAARSLALARRADDRELLDAGADVADIGLTEEEKRELLTG